MTFEWGADVILHKVQLYLSKTKIDQVFEINEIITFDGYGISGHTNHRAIHHALLSGIRSSLIHQPVYALQSVSVYSKYSFIAGVFVSSVWNNLKKPESLVFVSTVEEYMIGRAAMYLHKSQMVWFRHLYLWTSRYMIMNELKQIK